MDTALIYKQAREAIDFLLPECDIIKGDIFVVGCSTSEILGQHIGTASNEDIANCIMDALYPPIKSMGLYLAVQCCEHLNRALVIEKEAMEKYDFTQVSVKPWLHAGGAFGLQAIKRFLNPVMVEDINAKAKAGMDIGGTLIGMHLRPVVVPIKLTNRFIGDAILLAARTRPKYIGGPRARYDELKAH